MAFSQADKETILAAVKLRIPVMGACPICRIPNWAIGDGFTLVMTQDSPKGVVIGGPVMPCVSIICTNCGNTVLLNVLILGLKDWYEKKRDT